MRVHFKLVQCVHMYLCLFQIISWIFVCSYFNQRACCLVWTLVRGLWMRNLMLPRFLVALQDANCWPNQFLEHSQGLAGQQRRRNGKMINFNFGYNHHPWSTVPDFFLLGISCQLQNKKFLIWCLSLHISLLFFGWISLIYMLLMLLKVKGVSREDAIQNPKTLNVALHTFVS